MGKCFLHGNGGANPLNFWVIGYPTEDALQSDTPKENTIGIVTSHKITGTYFSQKQPENMEEGAVWILNGTSGKVAFNALKKGGIQVYPISAKQYVSGAWVEVTAKSYQNGAWVDWIVYLYKEGDACIDITGGYSGHGVNITGLSSRAPIITSRSDCMVLSQGVSVSVGIVRTNKAIDLTGRKTLYFYGLMSANDTNRVHFGVFPLNSDWATASTNDISGNLVTLALDVSSLEGEYYIGFYVRRQNTDIDGSYGPSITVRKLWLE